MQRARNDAIPLTGAAGLSSAVSARFAAVLWKPLASWLLFTSLLSDSLHAAAAAAAPPAAIMYYETTTVSP
jgi:hypothetical protein